MTSFLIIIGMIGCLSMGLVIGYIAGLAIQYEYGKLVKYCPTCDQVWGK